MVRRCFTQYVFWKILQNSQEIRLEKQSSGGVLRKSFTLKFRTQENTCTRVSFLKKFNFIKKATLARVFSCGFCEIAKNIFFTEHL